MADAGDRAQNWTAKRVEDRLIEAFCLLRGLSVYKDTNGLISRPFGRAERDWALNWARRFVPDRRDALALMTWARCRATGDSERECHREFGWSRNSAERARRRALNRIVAGLLEEQRGLDNGANRPGASQHDEADDALATS